MEFILNTLYDSFCSRMILLQEDLNQNRYLSILKNVLILLVLFSLLNTYYYIILLYKIFIIYISLFFLFTLSNKNYSINIVELLYDSIFFSTRFSEIFSLLIPIFKIICHYRKYKNINQIPF